MQWSSVDLASPGDLMGASKSGQGVSLFHFLSFKVFWSVVITGKRDTDAAYRVTKAVIYGWVYVVVVNCLDLLPCDVFKKKSPSES